MKDKLTLVLSAWLIVLVVFSTVTRVDVAMSDAPPPTGTLARPTPRGTEYFATATQAELAPPTGTPSRATPGGSIKPPDDNPPPTGTLARPTPSGHIVAARVSYAQWWRGFVRFVVKFVLGIVRG